MSHIRALIAEDEPLARRRLERLLRRRDDVEVAGAARDGDEALAMIAALAPDLIFLDIQMPGMGGFDVLREIGGAGRPFVIFTTAFDQYALAAPVVERVATTLHRVARRGNRARRALASARDAYATTPPRPSAMSARAWK